MKIALLTDGISPYVVGGMQTHSAVIANQLVKANNEVDEFEVLISRPLNSLHGNQIMLVGAGPRGGVMTTTGPHFREDLLCGPLLNDLGDLRLGR